MYKSYFENPKNFDIKYVWAVQIGKFRHYRDGTSISLDNIKISDAQGLGCKVAMPLDESTSKQVEKITFLKHFKFRRKI